MSKDMMAGFQLFQPDTVDGAIDLLSGAGENGWAVAGGQDFASAAAAAGLEVRTAGPFARFDFVPGVGRGSRLGGQR